VTFQATINAGTTNGTVITNTASIRSSQNDANAADNTASAPTTVNGNPSISGTVYNDDDGTGNFTAGELGIPNVTVTRTGTTGGTTTTDGNGNYSFINLPVGTYSVTYTVPSGFTNTGTRPISGITLGAGETATAQNFFTQQQSGTMSGFVYNDTNGDGIFDGADSGLSGVSVFRTGSATPAVTIASGAYSFAALPNGSYTISYTPGALRVMYGWNGFLQPINDTAHQTGVNESKFKLGQTVPTKFVLTDALGNVVQQAGDPTFTRSANRGSCDLGATLESVDPVPADVAPVFKLTGGQYLYGWSTKGLTAGEYRIYANLADGTAQYVDICLTK